MADYYEILGVAQTASPAEIRQAYRRLAFDKHPDRHSGAEEKKRAERAFQDITTAFNTLVNPAGRRDYDARRERPLPRTPKDVAAAALESGLALLAAGQAEAAASELRIAVHYAPGEAAHQLALGRALAARPESAREAVQVLELATQLAPRNAAAFADLAAALAQQGLRLRAHKALESARRLAPQDPRINRLASELGLG